MTYKITNVEYGIGPWGSEWLYGLVGNPNPGQEENNVHSVTLISNEEQNILVDTGIDMSDPVKEKLWNELLPTCNGVVWAFEQINVDPLDIDTVICTHAHIDHIGGIECFPNAQIYIQKEEFETWERLVDQPEYAQIVLPAAMPEDYPKIRKLIEEGKVTLLEGDVKNFLPGIDIHTVRNCHSFVEQFVCVRTGDGLSDNEKTYVIAGDVACRPANILGTDEWSGYLVPILGRSGSAYNVMQAYEWINKVIDSDPTRLVLTHDVTMRERFESKSIGDDLYINYIVK